MAIKQNEIIRAKMIARTLGTKYAVGYMRNRGWSVEAALWVLLGK